MSATTDRIENTLRVQLPGVTLPALRLEMAFVVDRLCRDALQVAAPNAAQAPDTWLSDADWQLHQRVIMDGTLARMFAQPAKPYSNTDLAAIHAGFFVAGIDRAREHAASVAATQSTSYARLLANLRVNVPGARDDLLLQELFNTVDDFARSVLQTTPPVAAAGPSQWLASELYDQHFRLLLAGTLARLLIQPGKPWSDPKLAAVQGGIYDGLATQARADFNVAPVVSPSQLLFENLRTQLPGSKDSQIRLELFNVIDEACRHLPIWVETLEVPIVAGQNTYSIAPSDGEVVALLWAEHPTLRGIDAIYDPDQALVNIGVLPAPEDVDTPVFVALQIAPPRVDEFARYLPGNLWGKHHQMLLDGVLGRMMAQPGKPYSSPKLAEYHLKRFRNFLAKAIVKATGAGESWRFPAAGTSRSRR